MRVRSTQLTKASCHSCEARCWGMVGTTRASLTACSEGQSAKWGHSQLQISLPLASCSRKCMYRWHCMSQTYHTSHISHIPSYEGPVAAESALAWWWHIGVGGRVS